MSGNGLHLHVQMADASTSTAEDGEIDFAGIGMSASPTATFNNYCEAVCEQEMQPGGTLHVDSAFTFPRPNYGYNTETTQKYQESGLDDPYNILRDEVS